jgi:hypothetical protein
MKYEVDENRGSQAGTFGKGRSNSSGKYLITLQYLNMIFCKTSLDLNTILCVHRKIENNQSVDELNGRQIEIIIKT